MSETILSTVRAHYRACFRAMAASVGNPWHLYRKPGTDRLMICMEGSQPEGWEPMVCGVNCKTEACVLAKVHAILRGHE